MGYPLFRIIFTIYSGVFWSKNSCLALLGQFLVFLQPFLVIFWVILADFPQREGREGGSTPNSVTYHSPYKIALHAIYMPQLAIYLCINHEDNNYKDDDD